MPFRKLFILSAVFLFMFPFISPAVSHEGESNSFSESQETGDSFDDYFADEADIFSFISGSRNS